MARRWANAWVAASGSSARLTRTPMPSISRLTAASRAASCRDAGTEYSRCLSIMHMASPSVGEPKQQIPGVVVGSVPPYAVIVAAAAVELVVAHVLRGQLGVEPGQVVHFRDPAPCVGGSVGARYHTRAARSGGPVQHGIAAAGGREIGQRTADLAAIVVGGPHARSGQAVGRICRGGGGEARVQIHVLVNARPRDRDLALGGDEVVL